jgi:hypothetical protein
MRSLDQKHPVAQLPLLYSCVNGSIRLPGAALVHARREPAMRLVFRLPSRPVFGMPLSMIGRSVFFGVIGDNVRLLQGKE